ncbi:hypothetical protein TIFTF001_023237 [Ficus carica]|uniref:Uncharacterized protein n=1 Tax=Ficus carica TaxID=3494 RepID=A0AA88AZY0_FICCA|nr:hypothetical protein TIFTF001_023237 [Ficus carica]
MGLSSLTWSLIWLTDIELNISSIVVQQLPSAWNASTIGALYVETIQAFHVWVRVRLCLGIVALNGAGIIASSHRKAVFANRHVAYIRHHVDPCDSISIARWDFHEFLALGSRLFDSTVGSLGFTSNGWRSTS